MAGIVSFGAYIPLYRMKRELLARAWGSGGGKGEKSVANWDEDSLTMAVESAVNCLADIDRKTVDGLYFASTTAPYQEKQSASIVAAAADLRRDIYTADFAHSVRAGTGAFQAALDTVRAGSAERMLVAAADSRRAAPDSEFESLFADGSAAFLLGDSDVAVEVEAHIGMSSEFMDIWKLPEEAYPRTWESRFAVNEGYVDHTKKAVLKLLEKTDVSLKTIDKVVYYGPDERSHARMGRMLGLTKEQIQPPLFNELGHTGAAFAPMLLVSALEEAAAGDRILYVGYGDGADAYLLRATDKIERLKERRGIKKHLQSKALLPSYEKYLKYKKLVTFEAERRDPDKSAQTVLWRESDQILSLIGHQCRQCQTIQYPMQRVCTWCQAKDDFERIRLSDKKGTIFTYSMDERAMVPDLPNVICIMDFEEGGRFYTRVTDRDPETVAVGMDVELTFRKLHDGSGIHNYFWLARPVRC